MTPLRSFSRHERGRLSGLSRRVSGKTLQRGLPRTRSKQGVWWRWRRGGPGAARLRLHAKSGERYMTGSAHVAVGPDRTLAGTSPCTTILRARRIEQQRVLWRARSHFTHCSQNRLVFHVSIWKGGRRPGSPQFLSVFCDGWGGKPAFPRCPLITTKKRKKINRKCCGQRPVIRPVADHAFSAEIFVIFYRSFSSKKAGEFPPENASQHRRGDCKNNSLNF